MCILCKSVRTMGVNLFAPCVSVNLFAPCTRDTIYVLRAYSVRLLMEKRKERVLMCSERKREGGEGGESGRDRKRDMDTGCANQFLSMPTHIYVHGYGYINACTMSSAVFVNILAPCACRRPLQHTATHTATHCERDQSNWKVCAGNAFRRKMVW